MALRAADIALIDNTLRHDMNLVAVEARLQQERAESPLSHALETPYQVFDIIAELVRHRGLTTGEHLDCLFK